MTRLVSMSGCLLPSRRLKLRRAWQYRFGTGFPQSRDHGGSIDFDRKAGTWTCRNGAFWLVAVFYAGALDQMAVVSWGGKS